MAHRLRLVALALFAVVSTATHAGYAQLATPTGFGGSSAGWTFATSANDQTFGRVIYQQNGLRVPVPGTAVKMPAAYRLAANAPRVAAAVIFANPYVRTGVGIAAWLAASSVVWNPVTNSWETPDDPSTETKSNGYEYRMVTGSCTPGATAWFPSAEQAVRAYAGLRSCNGDTVTVTTCTGSGDSFACSFQLKTASGSVRTLGPYGYDDRRASSCPVGWYVTPAGCVRTLQQSRVLTQDDLVRKLNPENQPGWPMPDTVPKELPPGTPLPVEQPYINPAPGPSPAHRPLFVPTGDPVPNPNYDPSSPVSPANQPYSQPGTRITPSPTPTEPWRVDIQPVNRPQPTPDPNPDPETQPGTDPADKPKTDEQQSLCEKHPDVVACAKTGTLEATPVPNETKTLTINKDTGYGPETGTCPAPKTATVMGQQLSMPYDLLCDFAGSIKPIVIAFAWLSAALTFFGFSRKDS